MAFLRGAPSCVVWSRRQRNSAGKTVQGGGVKLGCDDQRLELFLASSSLPF